MTKPEGTRADDAVFDTVYPARIRLISRRYWTPVGVARRAAELFQVAGARSVLDAGAGVGKFVLVAATACPAIEFVGIEQRVDLVAIAQRARAQLAVPNARFQVADLTDVSLSAFDGVYLFNPLAENLRSTGERIDDCVELTEERFERDALRLEAALRGARLGTAIVSYHGSSTRIPACYELDRFEPAGTDWLRLWIKRHEPADDAYFIEVDDGIVRRFEGARVRAMS